MQALHREGAMGATEVSAPVTPAEKAKAEKRIKSMRRSLARWLKVRKINDEAAMGLRKAKVPASILAKTLPMARDWSLEQRLAIQLHGLLSEFVDAAQLPNADIAKDPNAAVKLAQIAVGGRLPNEANAPQAQGFLPLLIWPVVVVVGMVLFVVMGKISSDADLAALQEENRCKASGACTDSGFWLKMGAIVVVGWIAWDKLGVKKAFQKGSK
jgi:hypothetical protein